ncbi:hypothetical protein CPJCM30710_29640 [Clostridium polyendosporum]|uniref:Uncharacterized protein n=1 Tax=Clostridium polyendosporum TaxID=69208 RepID=A0A919S316_9CLOT|nr:hypothetical protein CPJCM30710_29640 [Clostridium polyendosporum]
MFPQTDVWGILFQLRGASLFTFTFETTGSTGPMGNCLRYENGCSMYILILRCPSCGSRIRIRERTGVQDFQGERKED